MGEPPSAESPALVAALGAGRPFRHRGVHLPGMRQPWPAVGDAERASCPRQRPGGSTVVVSIPCQRLADQRRASLSWPNCHSVAIPLGRVVPVRFLPCTKSRTSTGASSISKWATSG